MEGSTGKTRNPWRVAKAKLGRGPSKRDDDPKISPKNPLEERGVGLHILPEVIKDIDAQKGNKGSREGVLTRGDAQIGLIWLRQGAAGPDTELRDREHGLGACGGCGAARAQRRAVPDPTSPGQGSSDRRPPGGCGMPRPPLVLPAVPAGSAGEGGAVWTL